MKSKSNIYAHAREHMLKEHSERLEGNREGIVLVVFTEPPSDVARNALDKSFDAIGYGPGACLFANVDGLEVDAVFSLVEGIDPLILVACDARAAELCARAVRQPFPPMQNVRLFGREARSFNRLNAMFDTEANRQAVWRLLKTM